MAKKIKTFYVTAEMKITANIEVKAENFSDAIEVAKSLRETNFIDFKGDFIEGEMLGITSLYSETPEKG